MGNGWARGFSWAEVTPSNYTNWSRCDEILKLGFPIVASILGDSKDESDDPRWSPYTVRQNANWFGVLAACSKGTLQIGNSYAQSGKTIYDVNRVSRGFTGPNETGKTQLQLACQDNSHIVFYKLSTNTAVGWNPPTEAQWLTEILFAIESVHNAGKVLCFVTDTTSGVGGTNLAFIRALGAKIKIIAAQYGCMVLSPGSPILFNASGTMNTATYGGDGVHPSDKGHELIGSYLAKQWFAAIGFSGWPDAHRRFTHGTTNLDSYNSGMTIVAQNGSAPYAPTTGSWSGTSPFVNGLVSDSYGHFLRKQAGAAGTISWNFFPNSLSVVAGNWYLLSLAIKGNCVNGTTGNMTIRWNLNWQVSGADITSPYAGTVAMAAPVYFHGPINESNPRHITVVVKAPPTANGAYNNLTFQQYGTTVDPTHYLDLHQDLVIVQMSKAFDTGTQPSINTIMDRLYLWKTG